MNLNLSSINAKLDSQIDSSPKRNVYNPSVIISTLNSPKKYKNLYQIRQEKPHDEYDHLGHKIKNRGTKEFQIHSIIKEAKE